MNSFRRKNMKSNSDEGSLLLDDLNEESSIESSLNSEDDNFDLNEVDDSDLDSEVDSVGYECSADTDSVESPLLSDSDLDLSDTLNEDDSDDDGDVNARPINLEHFRNTLGLLGGALQRLPTLLPLSSVPLSKITEHTRETSSSCHTSVKVDDSSSFLKTPSGRKTSSIRMGRMSGGSRNSRHSTDSTTPLPTTVIEWDAGLELGEKLNLLQLKPPNMDGTPQEV